MSKCAIALRIIFGVVVPVETKFIRSQLHKDIGNGPFIPFSCLCDPSVRNAME